MELTEKEKKSINLFSKYLQSHGWKMASGTVYVDDDGNYMDFNEWYSEGSSISVSILDDTEEILTEIIERFGMMDFGLCEDSCKGEFGIEIDCLEKTIEFNWGYWFMNTREFGAYADFKDKESFANHTESNKIIEWMTELKNKKINDGRVDYDGFGDSGQINDNIEFDNGKSMPLPAMITDLLYDMLESNFGGWEINEGSFGHFSIDFKEKTISLEHNQNEEEFHSKGEYKFNF